MSLQLLNKNNKFETETVSQYLQKIKTYYTTEQYAALMAALTELYYTPSQTLQLAEWHIYGSSRLGIYKANKPLAVIEDETITAVEYQTRIKYRYNGKKQYELTNHLGNVLAVVSNRKTAVAGSSTTFQADVVSISDYYPFGMVMKERSWEATSTDKYRFGFNGKENDNEINVSGGSYDFGARIYDSRLGRFLSTDPLEDELPWQSPYVISSNSPLWRIDPDGQWDVEVHAFNDRAKSGYAILIVKNNDGDIVYATIVKVVGTHRLRGKTYGDTPEGKYKILGWRKTGNKRYPIKSFGANPLLALDYRGEEGKGRNGMHLHGGRGAYLKKFKELMSTHGCIRIADDDIKKMKTITDQLEKDNPNEKKGVLTVTDDLSTPVKYSDKPLCEGKEVQLNKDKNKLDLWKFPEEVAEPDKTIVAPDPVKPAHPVPSKMI